MKIFEKSLMLVITLGCLFFHGAFPGMLSAQTQEELQRAEQDSVLKQVRFDQRLDAEIPLALPFVNEQGKAVRLKNYFGDKPVLLALAYYECPMLCTMVLNGIGQAIESIPLRAGKDFHIVVVSIDPRETPAMAAAKKKSYVERFSQGPESAQGWHFLTGDSTSIDSLAKTIGYGFVYLPEENDFAHPAGIVLVTPGGRVSRYLLGMEFQPRELRLGLVEASESRIGGLAEHIMLFCYKYDPSTGKYTLAVNRVVQAGGFMTATVLVGGIFLMLRRERRGCYLPKEDRDAG